MSIKTADNRTRTGANDTVRIKLPHLVKRSRTIWPVPSTTTSSRLSSACLVSVGNDSNSEFNQRHEKSCNRGKPSKKTK